jgi:hypothetical protein
LTRLSFRRFRLTVKFGDLYPDSTEFSRIEPHPAKKLNCLIAHNHGVIRGRTARALYRRGLVVRLAPPMPEKLPSVRKFLATHLWRLNRSVGMPFEELQSEQMSTDVDLLHPLRHLGG